MWLRYPCLLASLLILLLLLFETTLLEDIYIYICTFECMHYPRFSSDRFVNIGEEISCSRIIGNFYLRGPMRIMVKIIGGEGDVQRANFLFKLICRDNRARSNNLALASLDGILAFLSPPYRIQ